MRTQTTADRALGQTSGTEHGLPMHHGLNRSTTRHLPKLTEEEKLMEDWEKDVEGVDPEWQSAIAAVKPQTEKQKKDTDALLDDMAARLGQQAGPNVAINQPRKKRPKVRAARSMREKRESEKKKPDLSDLTPPSDDDDIKNSVPMDIAFRFLKMV